MPEGLRAFVVRALLDTYHIWVALVYAHVVFLGLRPSAGSPEIDIAHSSSDPPSITHSVGVESDRVQTGLDSSTYK